MQKEFSHILKVDELPLVEQKYKIVAEGDNLNFVAEVLQVPEVKEMNAELFLKREKNVLNLWGHIKAEMLLESVVSLQKFANKYEFDFTNTYDTAAKEINVDEDDWNEDLPEEIIGGKLDLVTAVIEQIALRLDAYPRREGEEFSFNPDFDVEEKVRNNPFEALAKLKK